MTSVRPQLRSSIAVSHSASGLLITLLSTLLSLASSSADGQQLGRRQRFVLIFVDSLSMIGGELGIVRLHAGLPTERLVAILFRLPHTLAHERRVPWRSASFAVVGHSRTRLTFVVDHRFLACATREAVGGGVAPLHRRGQATSKSHNFTNRRSLWEV